MKARIGTSFGLALLLALGVIATMLVLGMFSLGTVKAANHQIRIASIENVPDTPGEIATYTIKFQNPMVLDAGSGQLYVKFDDNMGVPTSIQREHIVIVTSDGARSNPLLDPDIDGNVVILTIDDTDLDSMGRNELALLATTGMATHTLQFSRLAGIVNSTVAGDATVALSNDSTNYAVATPESTLHVKRWLQLDSSSGPAGKVITITGKAFADGGTANIWLEQGAAADLNGKIDAGETVLGTSAANISGGEFTASFTVDASFSVGANYLNAQDGRGESAGTVYYATNRAEGPQLFKKHGSISVSPTSAARGETITVTLKDFGGAPAADGTVAMVKIGGRQVLPPDSLEGYVAVTYTNGVGEFSIEVPDNTPLGTQTVTVTTTSNSEPARSSNITVIGGFPHQRVAYDCCGQPDHHGQRQRLRRLQDSGGRQHHNWWCSGHPRRDRHRRQRQPDFNLHHARGRCRRQWYAEGCRRPPDQSRG